MARRKRVVVASIVSRKDNSGDYFKVGKNDIHLKAGQILNLESKKTQLKNLEQAIAEGKVTGESATNNKARIERIPDFIKAEVSMIVDSED